MVHSHSDSARNQSGEFSAEISTPISLSAWAARRADKSESEITHKAETASAPKPVESSKRKPAAFVNQEKLERILQAGRNDSKNTDYADDAVSNIQISGGIIRKLQIVTEENTAELCAESEQLQKAERDATARLARKALSAAELRKELTRLGHKSEIAEQIVNDFVAKNYIDEAALAESIVEKMSGTKSASKAEISRKLSQRMIDEDTAAEFLQKIDDERESELLREAAYSRAARLDDFEYEVAYRRLLGYLSRRGWSGYEVSAIAREALASYGVTR